MGEDWAGFFLADVAPGCWPLFRCGRVSPRPGRAKAAVPTRASPTRASPTWASWNRSLLVFGDVLRGVGGCYREWRVMVGDAGTERGLLLMATAARLKMRYGEGNGEAQAATAAAFEKAGYTVHKAVGRKAVETAIGTGGFDLVVLGPTLSRNDRHHLPYAVKKAQAEVSVLVMHADGSRHPYVDACTDTGASVENVLARIEGMAIAGMMPAAAAAGR